MSATNSVTGPRSPALELATGALRRVPAALGFGLLLAICALLGAVVALGSPQLDLLILAAIGGPLLLFVPARWVLPLLIVTGFVVVGLGVFYLRMTKLFWVPYMLCMFLVLKLPLDALADRSRRDRHRVTPLFVWMLFGFFAAVAITTLLNQTPLINLLVGGKHFLFVWALTFLVASRGIDDDFLRKCWLLLLAIAVLQLPFAALQRVFSHGNWDAVVGTFGGDPNGGGGSGLMAIFLAIAIGLAVALLKARQIAPVFGYAVIASGIGSVALGEVKVFFLLLPIVLAVVMRRDFVQRPALAFGVLAAGAITLATVAALYQSYYTNEARKSRSVSAQDYLDYVFKAEGNLDYVNLETGEVSRIGAPLIWVRTVLKDGPDKLLFGYGLTASRPSETIGKGVMAKRFPFALNTSALTIVLWDTGLVGLLTLCGALAAAAINAFRLSGSMRIPPFHRACLEGCAGAFVVMLVTLGYNDAAINQVSFQFLLPFALGYVLYWLRKLPQESRP